MPTPKQALLNGLKLEIETSIKLIKGLREIIELPTSDQIKDLTKTLTRTLNDAADKEYQLLTKLICFAADMDQTLSVQSFREKVPFIHWDDMADKVGKYIDVQEAQDLLVEAKRLGPLQTREEKIAEFTKMLLVIQTKKAALTGTPLTIQDRTAALDGMILALEHQRNVLVEELLANPPQNSYAARRRVG